MEPPLSGVGQHARIHKKAGEVTPRTMDRCRESLATHHMENDGAGRHIEEPPVKYTTLLAAALTALFSVACGAPSAEGGSCQVFSTGTDLAPQRCSDGLLCVAPSAEREAGTCEDLLGGSPCEDVEDLCACVSENIADFCGDLALLGCDGSGIICGEG
jgi:hypothetical protein